VRERHHFKKNRIKGGATRAEKPHRGIKKEMIKRGGRGKAGIGNRGGREDPCFPSRLRGERHAEEKKTLKGAEWKPAKFLRGYLLGGVEEGASKKIKGMPNSQKTSGEGFPKGHREKGGENGKKKRGDNLNIKKKKIKKKDLAQKSPFKKNGQGGGKRKGRKGKKGG